MSRSLYTSQIKLRRIHVKVDGTGANPAATGVDKFLVDSITDNAVGSYTINLTGKAKARNANKLDVLAIVPISESCFFRVSATTDGSVTVLFFEDQAETTALDVDFGIEIQANDNRFLVN